MIAAECHRAVPHLQLVVLLSEVGDGMLEALNVALHVSTLLVEGWMPDTQPQHQRILHQVPISLL